MLAARRRSRRTVVNFGAFARHIRELDERVYCPLHQNLLNLKRKKKMQRGSRRCLGSARLLQEKGIASRDFLLDSLLDSLAGEGESAAHRRWSILSYAGRVGLASEEWQWKVSKSSMNFVAQLSCVCRRCNLESQESDGILFCTAKCLTNWPKALVVLVHQTKHKLSHRNTHARRVGSLSTMADFFVAQTQEAGFECVRCTLF